VFGLRVLDDCSVCFLEDDISRGGSVVLEIRKVGAEHGEVVMTGISFANSSLGVLGALYGHVFGLDL
jgi:hypothetical protein